jgi:hypothetical protein
MVYYFTLNTATTVNNAVEPIIWSGLTANQIITIISISTTFMASLGAIIVNLYSINKNKKLSIENRYLNVITNNHISRIKELSTLVAKYCAFVLRNASSENHCIDDDSKVYTLSTQINLYCNRLSCADSVIKKVINECNDYYIRAINQKLSDDASKKKFIDSVSLVEKLLLIYIKVEYEEATYQANKGITDKYPFESQYIKYIEVYDTRQEIQKLQESLGINVLDDLEKNVTVTKASKKSNIFKLLSRK